MSESGASQQRYITGNIGKRTRPRTVTIEHLTALYQQQIVLHDISFSIYEGESIALLDPTRFAKTMLLACLQGCIQPAKGHIALFDTPIPPMTPVIRRQLGLMPHDTDRQSTIVSTADAVKYYATNKGIHLNPAQIKAYLSYYGLSAYIPVTQLPPLQRRVLHLALAVVHDPRLVLLDEPLAGLSKVDEMLMWQYLHRLQREGRTLLATFTPPIADESLIEYDVVIRLERGRIIH
ncbi:MAG: ATP-binding cassette domain-containing protein [Ktedonobacteraceae bacterium]